MAVQFHSPQVVFSKRLYFAAMDEQGKCEAGEGGEGEEKKVSVKRSQGDTSFATAQTSLPLF